MLFDRKRYGPRALLSKDCDYICVYMDASPEGTTYRWESKGRRYEQGEYGDFEAVYCLTKVYGPITYRADDLQKGLPQAFRAALLNDEHLRDWQGFVRDENYGDTLYE